MGHAAGSLDACLCKGQPYYVDIERAQWPKQACQPRQASICQGYKARGGIVRDDLDCRSATKRGGENTPFEN